MRSVVACARKGALATALVLGLIGLSPASMLAQQASPPENLVARCDLPVVALFNPLPGDVLQPGSYLISGLALDPLAGADTSGIDQVTFFLGDRDQGGLPLGSVVPQSTQPQGSFTVTVMLPSSTQGAAQQLEAFAHSAVSGKETELALPVVFGGAPADASQAAANAINTNPGALPETCSSGDVLPPPPASPATATNAPSTVLPAPKVGAVAPKPLFGTIMGIVTTCQGGTEQPVSLVTVQVQGTSATGVTDLSGVFAVSQVPAPGTYTVTVSDGGKTATRMYVPVAPGDTIDIGQLMLGADVTSGCGDAVPPGT